MNFQLSRDAQEKALFSQYLVNFIDNAACCLGADGRFMYVNQATCSLLRYSRQELLSMTLEDITLNFRAETWLEQWQEIQQKGTYSFNCQLRTKDEQILTVEMTSAYVKEQEKEFCCVLMQVRNESDTQTFPTTGLTPQVQGNTEQSIEEAQKFNELRARFFSTMCHQFRSFLNIISFSNSLLKRYLTQGTENKKFLYLDNIQTAVEQISNLLDSLIFLGKSEVGQLNCEPKAIDLNQLCRNLIEQMKPMSDGKQQIIDYISQGNSNLVRVDEELLKQILMNLLSNAIKYSPKKRKIELQLFCEERQCTFHIKDKGIGIPVEDRQRIFEPFYRGSNINNILGSGLGLAIVKNLVEIHGGQIGVESEVGIGTTFVVTIPIL